MDNGTTSKDRDALEYLMNRVNKLRDHQKKYFSRKWKTDKDAAMMAERQVDSILLKLIGRGYDITRFDNKTQQSKLFDPSNG